MFAVVEHQEQALRGEELDKSLQHRLVPDLPHADRAGDCGHDKGGIGQGGQIDEEDAIRVVVEGGCPDGDGEPRLARAARAGQRNEPDALGGEEPQHRLQVRVPTNEGSGWMRQIRRVPGHTAQRRESVWEPGRNELENRFRLQQVAQAVAPQGTQAGARREVLGDQTLDHRRQQNLGAVASGEQPRQPVQRSGQVVTVARNRLARVEGHAHAQRTADRRPRGVEQRALGLRCRRYRLRRAGKRRLSRVADHLEQHATVALDRATQQGEVAIDVGGRRCTIPLPPGGAALDVGEQERDSAAGERRHTCACRGSRISASALSHGTVVTSPRPRRLENGPAYFEKTALVRASDLFIRRRSAGGQSVRVEKWICWAGPPHIRTGPGGDTSCPLREPSGPSARASAALTRPRLMTYPVGDRSTDELGLESPVMATPATGSVFQRPGALQDPVS